MSERYDFVDMAQSGPAAVRTAFANQMLYCRANDAPITARIVAALGTLLDKPARCSAHELAPIYADAEDFNDAAIVAGVVARHEAASLKSSASA